MGPRKIDATASNCKSETKITSAARIGQLLGEPEKGGRGQKLDPIGSSFDRSNDRADFRILANGLSPKDHVSGAPVRRRLGRRYSRKVLDWHPAARKALGIRPATAPITDLNTNKEELAPALKGD